MKKILIAMSHQLTEVQLRDLLAKGYEPVISEHYKSFKMNQLDPELPAKNIKIFAALLVSEAEINGCSAIAMVGEPALTFYVWELALRKGLTVLQSTTKRINQETVQPDGTVKKIQIFSHIQWREIEKI